MKGGCVAWPPRLVCGVPRLCVGVPLVVYFVALLNGGCGVLCVVPVFGLGPPFHIVLVPFTLFLPFLYCLTSSRVVHSPFSLCVCCHSIVGLGLCLCDRVVSLWNSGGGLCGVEGRGGSIVYMSSCVVCVSVVCVL